jgi:hypothetical protein
VFCSGASVGGSELVFVGAVHKLFQISSAVSGLSKL